MFTVDEAIRGKHERLQEKMFVRNVRRSRVVIGSVYSSDHTITAFIIPLKDICVELSQSASLCGSWTMNVCLCEERRTVSLQQCFPESQVDGQGHGDSLTLHTVNNQYKQRN